MSCQKLKRKLRSAFAKEDILLTLDLINVEHWKYKGSLKEWVNKCLYYLDRYGEPIMLIDENKFIEDKK